MEYHLVVDGIENQTTVQIVINGGNRSYGSDIIQQPWVRGLLAATYSIICVAGALGNTLVLYYLYQCRHRSRLNSTDYLLMNLAVCDLITLTVYQPLRIIGILIPFATEMWMRTPLLYCQVSSFIGYISGTVGFHNLVAISLERFLVICYPIRSRSKVGVRSTIKTIGFIWILSFCCMIPVPLRYSVVGGIFLEDGTTIDICMMSVVQNSPDVSNSWTMYYTSIFVLYYILPLGFMASFYGAIFKTLNTDFKELAMQDNHLRKILKERKHISKRLVSIAVLFTLLHSPYFVTLFCITYSAPLPGNYLFTVVMFEKLMAINSMLNPYIYCAQSRSFFQRRMFSFLNRSDAETSQVTVVLPSKRCTRSRCQSHHRLPGTAKHT